MILSHLPQELVYCVNADEWSRETTGSGTAVDVCVQSILIDLELRSALTGQGFFPAPFLTPFLTLSDPFLSMYVTK